MTDANAIADIASALGQKQWKEDRDAAIKDDRENKRGFLILNPDLDLKGLDVEGRIIRKLVGCGEYKEYRVTVDPALKGATDSKTGEMRAGYWLEHMSFSALDPIVPFEIQPIWRFLG